MKRRVYSQALKDEAVQLSYQRDNVKELADELGIQVQRLYKWRNTAKKNTFSKVKSTIASPENLEVKRLKKALKEKELELEILKKAVHIFSKSDGKSINL